jgi:crotonobetainyl-CoA:carnitine CoA-transferase CaiB-like acyl-CoA transferase
VRVLEGLSVSVASHGPGVDTVLRHLGRLGASCGTGTDGDIVLASESHELLGGGLVASETTAQAALGLTDYIAAFDAEPARTGCDVASSTAGVCAALAALASVYAGGLPLRVCVSPLRALAMLKTIIWAARSHPDDWTGTHVRSRERLVDSGYRTRDGRVTLDFAPTGHAQWRAFVESLGLARATIARLETRWYETVGWGDDVDTARAVYEERLKALTTEEAIGLIRRSGGSSVAFQDLDGCLDHPQAQEVGLRDALDRGLPWTWSITGDHRPPLREPAYLERPLTGVRVVDLGVGGVGPFAATLLAWLGADVVKVEAPNEFILAVRPTLHGLSTTYLALNQGKRSVALNLKARDDLALAQRLIAGADVVIENFRAGALDRLGLGYADVRALNPAVVYCSATGYGSRGPLASEPCTDPHIQAFSGFAAQNADPRDGVPRRVRYYGLLDLVTSCVVAEGIVAGLLFRDRKGGSVRVETSMLQAVTDMLQHGVSSGCVPDGFFPAADGYVALTCRDDEDWRRVCDVLDAPRLRDDRFGTVAGRSALLGSVTEVISAELRRMPAAAWAHAFGRAGVPCVRVARDEEALARCDLWRAGLLCPLPTPSGVMLVAGAPPWVRSALESVASAPTPGADTDALRSRADLFWGPKPSRRREE